MRICYVASSGGGLETNVRALAPALQKAGHEVSIVYLGETPDANGRGHEADGFPTYYAPIGNCHYYLNRLTLGLTSIPLIVRSAETASSLAQTIRAIHRERRLDVLEVPEITFPFHDLPIPYVVRLHASSWMCRRMDGEPQPLADRFEIRFEARTLRRAAAISSPSQAVADDVRTACGLGTLPVEIIPLLVDVARFKPGSKSATPLVLFVGRVEKRKGADTLLRALPRVLAQCADCEFVFAGRVCEDMSELVANAPPQAKFLGPVPRSELVQWYQRAWVFAAPSLWDNSPNTIYEAMSCGTPVVATRVGGIPDLVDDRSTGWLTPAKDEDAIAEAIIALLSDANMREEMGRRGREKVIARYSLEKVAAQTVSFYEKVVAA